MNMVFQRKPEYENLKLKVYDHWELFLHKNQYPYLGRCYTVAKRQNASDLLKMNNNEKDEFFNTVLPEWYDTIQSVFPFDKENVAFFGNEFPHLHGHLIPRRIDTIFYNGISFNDPNPYGNYSPYDKKELNENTIFKIRNLIKDKLIY